MPRLSPAEITMQLSVAKRTSIRQHSALAFAPAKQQNERSFNFKLSFMDKRQQILEATATVMTEQGIESCAMSKVAKQAGCAAGTLYCYFDTKEELIRALYQHLVSSMNNACLNGHDGNAAIKTQFFQFWGNFYRFMLSSPRNRSLFEQLSASPAIDETLRDEAIEPIHSVIAQLLQQGKEQGYIKKLPDELLTTMTFGSLMMMAKKQQTVPECFRSEINEDDLLTVCWDAIKS